MRVDVFLVERGEVRSRTLAKKLISQGCVTIDGQVITKVAEEISEGEHQVVITPIPEMKYVSRGGLKLEGALEAFGVDPSGKIWADVGASTGGFTHCLLIRGATRVYAVDAGHNQLDEGLRTHPQVRSMEGVNARTLTPYQLFEVEKALCDNPKLANGDPFDGHVDGVVMDVSFVSQTLIHPAIAGLLTTGGEFVTLIKPQFEVGRGGVGKGGIVKSQKYCDMAVRRVCASAESLGFRLVRVIQSPIPGGDGNTEYLGYFVKG